MKDIFSLSLEELAKKIKVNKFRYIEEVFNNESSLLQVSSEIEGDLQNNWQKDLGDFLWNILPAGSVSGAPKDKTLEIIKAAELDERGYYSGIYGYFDGERLDSAVNIRYIEKTSSGLLYRSGGGITSNSNLNEVQIIRKDTFTNGGGYKSTTVNFGNIFNGDFSQNIRIYDGDQIIVRKNLKPDMEIFSKATNGPELGA